jgi:hypothetical protein
MPRAVEPAQIIQGAVHQLADTNIHHAVRQPVK